MKRKPDPEVESRERRGASRREFLAGAGLTGVAVAAGAWPALAPAIAEASAGGPALPMVPLADQRGYTAGRYAIELDGISSGFVQTTEGGNAYADVVTEKLGADHVVHKHLAGVKYEDFTISVGTGMSKGFYDWIKSSFDNRPVRKSGAIVSADYSFKELTRLSFYNGLIAEIGMPALDAASKDAAKMTIKFSPEYTRRAAKAGGSVNPGKSGVQKKWLPANFRLNIPGLDCTGVSKIEAITLKQKNVENPVGEVRDYSKAPGTLEVPNLVVTLTESHAKGFYDWHEDFVIKGNNGQAQEKGGTLDYLAPDLKTTLFSLKLENLGIFKLSPEKVEAGSENIRRVKAEMYCEKISFDYGPSTWA